jgi:two-component system phosphate regulon sensor histidine kinase PhoR
VAVRRSATTGQEYLYCAVPFSPAAGARVLRLAEPLELVTRLSQSLARATATAAAVALLVSLLVLAYVSGRFARRLQRLQRVARRIGEGDPGVRAPETPDDALGQLGRALNHMHTELDSRLEALRRERDDRERILAHMSDGVALIGADDRVVHVNHQLAELLGVALRPEPGTAFTAFTRVPELAGMLHESRAAGRTVERELRPWTTSTRAARATATPLGGGAVLLVLHDLSESEALQRMRQDFVANVSHELRTPLTSLRGYAETLLEGGLDDTENREPFVRVIRDQAVLLQALVEDLLSLAEMERPDATLRHESLDLRSLASEQVAGLRDAAARGGLALELLPGDAVMVVADRVRMSQVLANLIDNAIKYTEHGSVQVSLGLEDGRAWCEVRDTGAGIPAEDLPRIFERFYRVDKSRSRDLGGTGLGLSIVKHIVNLHGGAISVRSAPGTGSTFIIRLPVKAA